MRLIQLCENEGFGILRGAVRAGHNIKSVRFVALSEGRSVLTRPPRAEILASQSGNHSICFPHGVSTGVRSYPQRNGDVEVMDLHDCHAEMPVHAVPKPSLSMKKPGPLQPRFPSIPADLTSEFPP